MPMLHAGESGKVTPSSIRLRGGIRLAYPSGLFSSNWLAGLLLYHKKNNGRRDTAECRESDAHHQSSSFPLCGLGPGSPNFIP